MFLSHPVASSLPLPLRPLRHTNTRLPGLLFPPVLRPDPLIRRPKQTCRRTQPLHVLQLSIFACISIFPFVFSFYTLSHSLVAQTRPHSNEDRDTTLPAARCTPALCLLTHPAALLLLLRSRFQLSRLSSLSNSVFLLVRRKLRQGNRLVHLVRLPTGDLLSPCLLFTASPIPPLGLHITNQVAACGSDLASTRSYWPVSCSCCFVVCGDREQEHEKRDRTDRERALWLYFVCAPPPLLMHGAVYYFLFDSTLGSSTLLFCFESPFY